MGKQHYFPRWVAKHKMNNVEFKNIQFRDEIKNKYALQNKIRLIRIPYTKFDKIDSTLHDLICS
jgi:hypothetical protein